MSYHKELLSELVEDWNLQQVNDYIIHLTTRRSELDEWINHVKQIKRKKTKKQPLENGPRHE